MNIEDLLREAAPGANDLYLAGLPDPKDCHHAVSKRFERKMKKLLKRQKSPVLYWAQRSVACFLLVVLLGGTTVLTFSAEARAAFFGWVREVYEDLFEYHFEGDITQPIQEVVYRPTWLPDGYSETATPELDEQVNVIYTNEDGNLMLFAYSTNPEIISLQIAQKECTVKHIEIGDTQGDFYVDHDVAAKNVLVWTNNENNIIYWISANLGEEDMVKIARSVKPLK